MMMSPAPARSALAEAIVAFRLPDDRSESTSTRFTKVFWRIRDTSGRRASPRFIAVISNFYSVPMTSDSSPASASGPWREEASDSGWRCQTGLADSRARRASPPAAPELVVIDLAVQARSRQGIAFVNLPLPFGLSYAIVFSSTHLGLNPFREVARICLLLLPKS